jgi:hypothetical protein
LTGFSRPSRGPARLDHLGADAFFLRDGLLDGDGFDALDRDHLGQLVDLPEGHLQHAAHVAHGGLGQKRAEGDDLPHPVAAVFLLHVADDLFPAVHAEVDVEVGHRHPFGVQEPLEQQRVAQWIEVGDRQRIGHQTARARAAPRTDRDVVVLGPFDEVGNDQEVAREAHPLDDAKLELQPLFVLLHRRRMGITASAP